MNRLLVSAAALSAGLALVGTTNASVASAKNMPKSHVQVIKRDHRGHATMVRVDGKEYQVCRKGVTDNCINPRAAGLHWGDTPIAYWPGKPASDIHHSLPAHRSSEERNSG